MRALRSLALATILTVSTSAATFANGISSPPPGRPAGEIVQDDGGGYSLPANPGAPSSVEYGQVWA